MRLEKVSLELGRAGNKDLGLEVVVDEVTGEDKTCIYRR